ncbi:MAG: response regulator [Gemmatimonadaceae bacterium]
MSDAMLHGATHATDDDAGSPPLRLVLADDHALVLEGLRGLLAAEPGLHVLATATDGERLLEAVRRFRPDVAVMDLQMPYMSGLSCLERIRAEGLPVRVLVLSAFADAHSLRAAVEGGADGFSLKTEPPRATVAAIRQVAAGQLVFPQAARRWLHAPAGGGGAAADPHALTDREEAVLAFVAEGKSNADIAAAMHLSESTVKFHLRNLFAKLDVANRTEAAARYHRRS